MASYLITGASTGIGRGSALRLDRKGHTRLASTIGLRCERMKLLRQLVCVNDSPGFEVLAAELDLTLNDRIAELQVVLELVDVHNGSYGHSVTLEDNVLLVAMNAPDHVAELSAKLRQG